LSADHVARVHIVFGLKPYGNYNYGGFNYDDDFDIEFLPTQIFLSWICRKMDEVGDSYAVRKSVCVIDAFKQHLLARRERYPVTPGNRIHGLLDDFVNNKKQWAEHVGFADGRVRFIRLDILTNLPSRLATADALPWAKRWDTFIAKINAEAQMPPTLPQCFHTSSLWVRADAEKRLIDSTILCAVASVAYAAVTVFWFLGNLIEVILLMYTVIGIIVALSTVMFVVFAWSFGVIEAVALIIIVGFSVDYALHIAEAYNQSKGSTRYDRVQDALRRRGGALLGAAATSVLACPPILYCTIQVFVRFGITLLANMLLSLVFSLLFFAAILIAVGPSRTRGHTLQQSPTDTDPNNASGKDSTNAALALTDMRQDDAAACCSSNGRGCDLGTGSATWHHLSPPSVVKTFVRPSSRQPVEAGGNGQAPLALCHDAWANPVSPEISPSLLGSTLEPEDTSELSRANVALASPILDAGSGGNSARTERSRGARHAA
jgi:hypothetical protein